MKHGSNSGLSRIGGWRTLGESSMRHRKTPVLSRKRGGVPNVERNSKGSSIDAGNAELNGPKRLCSCVPSINKVQWALESSQDSVWLKLFKPNWVLFPKAVNSLPYIHALALSPPYIRTYPRWAICLERIKIGTTCLLMRYLPYTLRAENIP